MEVGLGAGQGPTRRFVNWYLAVRILVITLFLGGTVVSQLREIQSGSQIICEPMARSTGPAVLAAAVMLP